MNANIQRLVVRGDAPARHQEYLANQQSMNRNYELVDVHGTFGDGVRSFYGRLSTARAST